MPKLIALFTKTKFMVQRAESEVNRVLEQGTIVLVPVWRMRFVVTIVWTHSKLAMVVSPEGRVPLRELL